MSVHRISQNLIKSYGRDKFVQLLQMFMENVPGPKIAEEFQVSRQRVHQWKQALGTEKTTYTPHPEVERIIAGISRTRTTI